MLDAQRFAAERHDAAAPLRHQPLRRSLAQVLQRLRRQLIRMQSSAGADDAGAQLAARKVAAGAARPPAPARRAYDGEDFHAALLRERAVISLRSRAR